MSSPPRTPMPWPRPRRAGPRAKTTARGLRVAPVPAGRATPTHTSGTSVGSPATRGAPASADAVRPATDDASDQRGCADSQGTSSLGSRGDTSGGKPTPNLQSSKSGSSGGTPVQVAAAIGIDIALVDQKATIPAGLHVTAGAVSLSASGNTDAHSAGDGQAVTTGPATGTTVGAGVAVTLAFPTTLASVGNGVVLNATSLSLTAGMTSALGLTPDGTPPVVDSRNDYSALATSGAGGGKNSVAGSLAFNLVLSSSEASIGNGAQVTLTGAASASATSSSDSVVKALPGKDGATAKSFGLGLSIALNIVVDDTLALVKANVVLTGATGLSLLAHGGHTMTTYAENGAKSTAAGGDAITPVIAIAVSVITGQPDVMSGAVLTLGASGLSEDVSQRATADTRATGSASAADAAVGISLALTVAVHKALASIERDLTTTGPLSFTVVASSDTDALAKASASGTKGEDDSSRTSGGTGAGGSRTANDDVSDQRGFADSQGTSSLGSRGDTSGGKPTPNLQSSKSGSSGGTPVQVAAAIGIDIALVDQKATIPAGLHVTAGAVSLSASGNTDAHSAGDGQAVTTGPATGTTVGAGVAVTLAFPTTLASVGNGVVLNATSLSLTAGMTSALGLTPDGTPPVVDSRNDYSALATSGAGGGKNSVAGSLAFNLVLSSSEASIGNGAQVTLTGAASASATSSSDSVVKALPGKDGATAKSFGLGLSIALNIVVDDTLALVKSNVVLTGASGLSLVAHGGHTMTTYAENGAKTTGAGGDAITPVIA